MPQGLSGIQHRVGLECSAVPLELLTVIQMPLFRITTWSILTQLLVVTSAKAIIIMAAFTHNGKMKLAVTYTHHATGSKTSPLPT